MSGQGSPEQQKFADHLVRRGLRMTAQRRAILLAVFATNQHFTADQLLVWSRDRDPSISRATVYRTLPLLVECELVRELDLGEDHRYYDPNYSAHPNHGHIVCLDCGKIFEFESSKIEPQVDEIVRRQGFLARARRLQVMASCVQWQQTGQCPHKSPSS
jgi:Fur family transcriptional regulator, ferric uptake regulator